VAGDGSSAAFGDGVAGVLAFLLRLHGGGPRMWMYDQRATGADR
jgi:hypothetical protein